MKHVGVLLPFAKAYPEAQARIAAFQQRLTELGWVDGRNVRTEIRRSGNDTEDIRKHAVELIALALDAILADGSPCMTALQ